MCVESQLDGISVVYFLNLHNIVMYMFIYNKKQIG